MIEPTKRHPRELCDKCKALGYYCGFVRRRGGSDGDEEGDDDSSSGDDSWDWASVREQMKEDLQIYLRRVNRDDSDCEESAKVERHALVATAARLLRAVMSAWRRLCDRLKSLPFLFGPRA